MLKKSKNQIKSGPKCKDQMIISPQIKIIIIIIIIIIECRSALRLPNLHSESNKSAKLTCGKRVN